MSSRAFIAWLLLIAVILLVVLARNAHNEPLILVDAAAPVCPKAQNPCDRTDCNRPEKVYVT